MVKVVGMATAAVVRGSVAVVAAAVAAAGPPAASRGSMEARR